MSSKRSKRQETPNSYKYIHLKTLNISNKQTSQSIQEKNIEYFPNKLIKRVESNCYLDVSKSNTNKQYSQSSRYSKRQSFSNATVQQQSRNLHKENEKLKKEVIKYEKMILEKEDERSITKKLQLQLVQTYRVIHYYEGKVKQQEKICKLYEKQLEIQESRKSKAPKSSQILQDLRNSISELSGKLQQKTFQLNKVTTELRKVQSKYHTSQQKILELNKTILDKRTPASKTKFIDDYQQNNLICNPASPQQPFLKRRQLSKSKRFLKGSNKVQTDSDSGLSSKYKSNVYTKRKTENLSISRQDNLRSSKHKSTALGNLNSRLNNIENEVEALKKENEKLQNQLDAKVKQLNEFKQLKQQKILKIPIEQEKGKQIAQIEPRKVTIAKNKLREIENPTKSPSSNSLPKNEQNKLSMFVSNISSKGQINQVLPISRQKIQNKMPERQKKINKQGYIFTQIKERTLRKLILNLVREDITYFSLIESIVQAWTSSNPNTLIELFEQAPYQLNSQQISQFMFEYKHIMKYISGKQRQSAHKDLDENEYKKYVAEEIKNILKNNISFYKNITIRRDFTLNIQLSNKFKNYEEELEEIMKKYGNRLPFIECQTLIVNKWGITAEQYLFLQIKNYQQYEDIDYIQISDLGKYFLLQ